MLRKLALPAQVKGTVYLMAMPGIRGDYSAERDAIRAAGVESVLCLTPLDEIEEKSSRYAEAIKAHLLPWQQIMLPAPDFGVADDRDAWLAHIREIAGSVEAGGSLAIHCAAGIGRTGTAAICLLMTLGVKREEAWDAAVAAGSRPEAEPQLELIEWVAEVLKKG
jgi:atypical dual specificity phosphatase